MSNLNSDDCFLMIIDIQEKLINAIFNKDTVKHNSSILAKTVNILSIQTVVTEQYPKGLGKTAEYIQNEIPNIKYFEKTAFDALSDKNLVSYIKNLNKKQVIICGIETHICVHQTVDSLLKNFDVTIISDACGSRSEIEHLSALNVMSKNGANIKTTEMILFELLKSAKHPNFKEIQALIK